MFGLFKSSSGVGGLWAVWTNCCQASRRTTVGSCRLLLWQ